MIIIKYNNESEVADIIAEQTTKGLHVVAVSNVGEGDFLGFDDRDIIPVQTISTRDEQLQTIQDNQMTLLDVQVATYEAILLANGGV